MNDFKSLDAGEIAEGIEKTRAAMKAAHTYLEYLQQGRGLPTNSAARQELQVSFLRITQKLAEELHELERELQLRN